MWKCLSPSHLIIRAWAGLLPLPRAGHHLCWAPSSELLGLSNLLPPHSCLSPGTGSCFLYLLTLGLLRIFSFLIYPSIFSLSFFKKIFYLFIHERHRGRGRDKGRGRSRLHAGGPDVGLHPETPGSRPGPKAGAKPLSHPGIPVIYFCILKLWVSFLWLKSEFLMNK